MRLFSSKCAVSRGTRSSRPHGLLLPHSEALSGPSPECDTALLELQRVPDMAPRARLPPERDLSGGLSKVKGSLQAGWLGQGASLGKQPSEGSTRGPLGPLRGGTCQVEMGMTLNGERSTGDRLAGGGGGSLRKVRAGLAWSSEGPVRDP